jgi:hypothetical protein
MATFPRKVNQPVTQDAKEVQIEWGKGKREDAV